MTGDTGAGKPRSLMGLHLRVVSGRSSGRSPEAIRCSEASMQNRKHLTYAEYIFEYKDAVYTVKRSPDYERPKTRGTGMTTQKGEALLTFLMEELL